MPRYPSTGITKLSQLAFDADKDCASIGLENLKEVVAGMAVGDMIYHDGTGIKKITPGPVGSELVTQGPGRDPYWGWPG